MISPKRSNAINYPMSISGAVGRSLGPLFQFVRATEYVSAPTEGNLPKGSEPGPKGVPSQVGPPPHTHTPRGTWPVFDERSSGLCSLIYRNWTFCVLFGPSRFACVVSLVVTETRQPRTLSSGSVRTNTMAAVRHKEKHNWPHHTRRAERAPKQGLTGTNHTPRVCTHIIHMNLLLFRRQVEV